MSETREIVDLIKEKYKSFANEISAFRKHLHSFPEIGWRERETTQFIFDELVKNGLDPHKFDPTGLYVEILPEDDTALKREFYALRADIDALPITENTGLPYASQNDGVSHACGHDFHTASAFGAALVLNSLRKHLIRPVRIIFQPAEEAHPGGAKVLIEQGAMKNVSQIYALHVEPRLEVGKVGVIQGAITSAADIITVKLKSKGGHSSRPHLTADIVQALGAVVLNTTALFSRLFDPRSVVSITWGKINAGTAPNAIPQSGELCGTLRTTDIEAWRQAEAVSRKVIEQITAPYGVETEIIYSKGVPPVINTEIGSVNMRNAVTELFGGEHVIDAERSLGGEDFSWYLMEITSDGKQIEGGMARLGASSVGAPKNDIHQADLVIDEGVLDISVPYFSLLMLQK